MAPTLPISPSPTAPLRRRRDADARRRRQRHAEARRRDLSGAGPGAGAGLNRAVATKRRGIRPPRRAAPGSISAPKATRPRQRPRALPSLSTACFPSKASCARRPRADFRSSVSLGKGFGAEAYAISFSPTGAAVSGGTRTGLLYGLITLGQILRGARHHPETFLFPAGGEIRDEPALGWRGIHLDVGAAILRDRRDHAVPRNPRLEQAQPLPLASVRRRGLACRDRRLSRS